MFKEAGCRFAEGKGYRPYTGQLFDMDYRWPGFPLDRVDGVGVCHAEFPADTTVTALPAEINNVLFTVTGPDRHEPITIDLFGRRIRRFQMGATCTDYFR